MEEARTNKEWLEYWLAEFQTASAKIAEAAAAGYNGEQGLDYVKEMKKASTRMHVANREIRTLREEIAREDKIKNEQQRESGKIPKRN